MKKILSQQPTMSINVKDSLIVIHKNTLRILGYPEYIQILVNPTEKTIILCQSSSKDHLAHPVKNDIFSDGKKSFRLHSYPLLQELHKIYPKWTEQNTYRISGNFISSMSIIKFNMNDSLLFSKYDKEICYE